MTCAGKLLGIGLALCGALAAHAPSRHEVAQPGPLQPLDWILPAAGALLAITIALALFALVTSLKLRRQAGQLELTVAARTAQIASAEAKYRNLFEQSHDAICLLDERLLLTDGNPAAQGLLGAGHDELVGRSLTDFLASPEEGQRLRAILQAGLPARDIEARLATVGARSRHVLLAVHPRRDDAGRGIGFQVILHDVSEVRLANEQRRTLEEQLQQSLKLESIGQLAGGIAHDFNNLLMAILGYADLLTEWLAGDEKGQAQVQQIRRAGERAAELTRQLLTFGRRQFSEPRPVDLNKLVEGLQRMLSRLIPENIRIAFRPGAGLGIVNADASQLEQMILNLCVNSRDAMPGGGSIEIETRRVGADHPFPGSGASEHAMLRVTDTGSGMSPEVKERIFEPFFTTKEVGKGTGLGLATVYGFVSQMGGRINVHSTPGVGTTFEILLPVAPHGVEVEGRIEPGPVPHGSETVLVAEDDDLVLDIARQILERSGYDVLTARDGDQALAVFEQHSDEIALVLLDAVMPGKSGREIYEGIKAMRPQARILFCSGYDGDVLPAEFLQREEPNLVRKPYDSAVLLRRVREILDT